MQIDAANTPSFSQFARPVQDPLLGRQQDFAAALGRAVNVAAGGDAKGDARRSAEQLVAQTFVVPLLRMVREANQTPPPFGPSTAEKQMASLLDAQLADRIVRGSDLPLVERLSRDLLRDSGTPLADAAA